MNDRLSPSARKLLLPLVVVLLVFGLPWLIQPIAKAILVLFAGILFAIFIGGLILMLQKLLPMPHWLAWSIVVLILILATAGFGYFSGQRILDQMQQLAERLPEAIETLRSKLPIDQWLDQVTSGQGSGMISQDLVGRVTGFFTTFLASLAYVAIILFLGIYLSFNPRLYMNSLVRLLPKSKRPRGEEVLDNVGTVMRWWLIGRFSSMAVVGALTVVGLFIIGEPLAFILGVIAGLFSFIPFLGPVLSAVPAILIGASRSLMMGFWVIVVFIAVQQVESNMITPIIQRKAVMLPPAYLIAAQFILGVLVGFFGILLATPITVLITVLVQMLYVQDVLGDDVRLLGEHGPRD